MIKNFPVNAGDMDLIPALAFLGDSDRKASAYKAGDPGSIPGSGRFPGEGNGSPLQYSYLENPVDEGTWQTTVHGVAKSRTRLGDFTFTFWEDSTCLGATNPECHNYEAPTVELSSRNY